MTAPTSTDPASFGRYLRTAARRTRKRTGTSLRYEVVVAVLWFGPGVAVGIWRDLDQSSAGISVLNWPAAGLLMLGGAALVGLACVTVGPVTASREWRSWVLSTPLDRGILLRRRSAGVLVLLVVPGIVLGALIADASGFRHGQALGAVAVGVGAVVGAGGLAMWQQRMRAAGSGRGRGWLWSAAAFGIAAVGFALRPVGQLDSSVLPLLAPLTLLAGLGVGLIGLSGVGLIPLSSLAAGSGSVSAVALAIADQSLAPLAAVIAGPPSRRRTRAPNRPLHGTGRSAVVAVTRRRTLRNRSAIARWCLMVLIPYGAWALLAGVSWSGAALAMLTFFAGVAAISGLCGTVRQFAGTPTLADRYGLDRREAKSAAMRLPQLAAAGWAVLTAPVLALNAPSVMVVLVPVAALALVQFRAGLAPFRPSYIQGQQYANDMTRLLLRGLALLFGGALLLGLITAGLTQRHL
ncbi:hypothetical protein SAMN04515671_3082 [Nakamurella panacisegetis]|uniref:Uncharacterized protein n=1 Tax=Nakamurella panacisegetis TaxID=1090615 RepID=A0A1H0QGI3_9ACTN|nr:DUF6297 family protein [Nakamurella panacisegetis]SDP16165.1 hypothetical protein SAMN04515671_3082 [Nakamurella panacisegetis]